MNLKPAVSGDAGDDRTLILHGISSLTGASAQEAHVWLTGGTSSDLLVTITDAAECEVSVALSPWLTTAAPGTYNFEVEVTFAGGDIFTWPADAPARLKVRDDGA